MIAYKLFRMRRDGTIGSLYINRKARLPVDEWLRSDLHPTKGFAVREGWHVLAKPVAPHLKPMSDRVWYKVQIRDWSTFFRPANQGGQWYLAKWMRIIGPAMQMV